ncbi:ferritin-like domain-containing protein [Paludisphaera rhizosphaerae]|uniref:ferritin-like domain-containing protein n=1 Tax=Paludisphaera rhizosphaerae TaxID=2711216 RepID=UPI0013ECB8E9|nr:ferritin-like protein [Paludisphaera rhizosphaerae]
MTSANAIVELMKVPPEDHDLAWLKRSLQAAVQLEFATIPPYLTALWSIKDLDGDVAQTILGIAIDEMRHMGIVCNLLAGLGERPRMAEPDVVPAYPTYLPGGVHPDLWVTLSGLSKTSAELFTHIELPENPLALVDETFPTIGEFYDAISAAFTRLAPVLSDANQVESATLDLTKLTQPDEIASAIALIKHQGEGSDDSPDSPDPSTFAHYYLFKEIATGRHLVKDAATGIFSFTGDPVAMPDSYPVAEIPQGGYLKADVTADVWEKLDAFDHKYSDMLRTLESAWSWTPGDPSPSARLSAAVRLMRKLEELAVDIVSIPIPNGQGNYGPCFRLVDA